MAILKLTAETIRFSGNTYYQNTARVFDALCALVPDIEVVERVADASVGFKGYFRFSWAPDYVFCIYSDETVSGAQYKSSIKVADYIKSDAGTVTIGGELYMYRNYVFGNYAASSGNVTDITVLIESGKLAVCFVNNSEPARYAFGVMKMREICSGEELFVTINSSDTSSSISGHSLVANMLYDGAISSLTSTALISLTADNGFVRMIPVAYYGCKKIATCVDPTAICTGYAKGVAMSFTPFTEFSVGGNKFFATSATRAIKFT